MSLLQIRCLSVELGVRRLLDGIELSLPPGQLPLSP